MHRQQGRPAGHQRRGKSLYEWPVGRPAIYMETQAGPTAGRRLAQLGLRAGSTLTPVQRTPGGGVVVAAGELRMALDRASATAMWVHECAPQAPAATPEAGPA